MYLWKALCKTGILFSVCLVVFVVIPIDNEAEITYNKLLCSKQVVLSPLSSVDLQAS